MRRQLGAAIAVLTLSLGLSGAPVANSVQRDDPVKERDRVRAQQAAVASRLDVQKASLAKIDEALQALTADLSAEQALLGESDQNLANARQRLDAATAGVAQIKGHISQLIRQMRERAVAAYVNPPGDQTIDILRMTSIKAANFRRMYGEVRAASDADLADQLHSARSDLEFARRSAVTARHVAEVRRTEQQARTRRVSAARSRQLTFAAAMRRRINASLGEAIRLGRTNKALSARIALEQAALVARLAAARAAAQEAAARARAAAAAARSAAAARAERARAAAAAAARSAAAAAATQQNTFRANGSEARALPPAQAQVQAPAPAQALPSTHQTPVVASSDGISLATVGGITVAAQIAGQLQALLTAARTGGLNLTGGGYRSATQQITLRQAHCGASYYAIYQMSAGSCHPPTAPPGQSMHEVGLAIDFSSCGSHSTACYQWLSANASRFGFFNLPSEPWHWSINGR